jgi:hypothetical protein
MSVKDPEVSSPQKRSIETSSDVSTESVVIHQKPQVQRDSAPLDTPGSRIRPVSDIVDYALVSTRRSKFVPAFEVGLRLISHALGESLNIDLEKGNRQ